MKKYLFTLLFFLTLQANAHHSFSAEFDAKAPVNLKGKVTKVELINPHAWIPIQTQSPGKSVQNWMFECGSPNILLRSGINRNTLKVGTEINVRGYQSKDHSCKPVCKASGRDITLSDGKTIFTGSTGTDEPQDGLDPSKSK